MLDDCGIVGIDNAFAGAMSYQPAVASKDMKMLVSISLLSTSRSMPYCRSIDRLQSQVYLVHFLSNILLLQLYSESYSYTEANVVKGSFSIDKTLGRDVEIEISYKVPSTLSFQITYPNGTFIQPDVPVEDTTFIYKFGSTALEVSLQQMYNVTINHKIFTHIF